MRRTFRQTDRQRLGEFTESLRALVYAAQPEYSVGQLAAALSSGTDDRHAISEATLYKCMEGERKFPAHKLAALTEITDDTRVIECLCEQHNGVFWQYPTGQDLTYEALPDTYRAFTGFVDSVVSVENPHSDGGRVITDVELEEGRHRRDQLIAQAMCAWAEVEARAENQHSMRRM